MTSLAPVDAVEDRLSRLRSQISSRLAGSSAGENTAASQEWTGASSSDASQHASGRFFLRPEFSSTAAAQPVPTPAAPAVKPEIVEKLKESEKFINSLPIHRTSKRPRNSSDSDESPPPTARSAPTPVLQSASAIAAHQRPANQPSTMADSFPSSESPSDSDVPQPHVVRLSSKASRMQKIRKQSAVQSKIRISHKPQEERENSQTAENFTRSPPICSAARIRPFQFTKRAVWRDEQKPFEKDLWEQAEDNGITDSEEEEDEEEENPSEPMPVAPTPLASDNRAESIESLESAEIPQSAQAANGKIAEKGNSPIKNRQNSTAAENDEFPTTAENPNSAARRIRPRPHYGFGDNAAEPVKEEKIADNKNHHENSQPAAAVLPRPSPSSSRPLLSHEELFQLARQIKHQGNSFPSASGQENSRNRWFLFTQAGVLFFASNLRYNALPSASQAGILRNYRETLGFLSFTEKLIEWKFHLLAILVLRIRAFLEYQLFSKEEKSSSSSVKSYEIHKFLSQWKEIHQKQKKKSQEISMENSSSAASQGKKKKSLSDHDEKDTMAMGEDKISISSQDMDFTLHCLDQLAHAVSANELSERADRLVKQWEKQSKEKKLEKERNSSSSSSSSSSPPLLPPLPRLMDKYSPSSLFSYCRSLLSLSHEFYQFPVEIEKLPEFSIEEQEIL